MKNLIYWNNRLVAIGEDSGLQYVNVASKQDVPLGEMKAFEVNGTSVLIVNLANEYFAIANKCTHRGCKLSKGSLSGEVVKCPCHGSRFNIKTGEVVGGPAAKSEQKYEVKIEQNQIQINI